MMDTSLHQIPPPELSMVVDSMMEEVDDNNNIPSSSMRGTSESMSTLLFSGSFTMTDYTMENAMMNASLDLNQHDILNKPRNNNMRGMDSEDFTLADSFALGESVGDVSGGCPPRRSTLSDLETVLDNEEDDMRDANDSQESIVTLSLEKEQSCTAVA